MRAPVLILTSSFGEGHNAAARAIAAALEEVSGPGAACVRDIFALARPRLNAWSRNAYLRLINRAPSLWSAVYRSTNGAMWTSHLLRLFRAERALLKATMEEVRPSALCSTYPIYSLLLDQLGPRTLPHHMVVTDSISLHSLWWAGTSDCWHVPNEESAEVLERSGVATARIRVSGFPVSLQFSRHAGRLTPPDLAQPSARPRILHIINSGTVGAEETARMLLRHDEWDVTCAVGRDAAMKHRLEDLASRRPRPATLLGWTDRIPELLMTHNVVISKAGGATTQEAIAAHCPMIVSQVVPGQEEGNYELLRRRQAGLLATTPQAIETTLTTLFSSGGAQLLRMREALRLLAKPEAAQSIARRLLEEKQP